MAQKKPESRKNKKEKGFFKKKKEKTEYQIARDAEKSKSRRKRK